jgi:hypothetical protein
MTRVHHRHIVLGFYKFKYWSMPIHCGYDLVWHGRTWYGIVWHGLTWSDMVWHGRTWYGMVWHGLTWSDMASIQPQYFIYVVLRSVSVSTPKVFLFQFHPKNDATMAKTWDKRWNDTGLNAGNLLKATSRRKMELDQKRDVQLVRPRDHKQKINEDACKKY